MMSNPRFQKFLDQVEELSTKAATIKAKYPGFGFDLPLIGNTLRTYLEQFTHNTQAVKKMAAEGSIEFFNDSCQCRLLYYAIGKLKKSALDEINASSLSKEIKEEELKKYTRIFTSLELMHFRNTLLLCPNLLDAVALQSDMKFFIQDNKLTERPNDGLMMASRTKLESFPTAFITREDHNRLRQASESKTRTSSILTELKESKNPRDASPVESKEIKLPSSLKETIKKIKEASARVKTITDNYPEFGFDLPLMGNSLSTYKKVFLHNRMEIEKNYRKVFKDENMQIEKATSDPREFYDDSSKCRKEYYAIKLMKSALLHQPSLSKDQIQELNYFFMKEQLSCLRAALLLCPNKQDTFLLYDEMNQFAHENREISLPRDEFMSVRSQRLFYHLPEEVFVDSEYLDAWGSELHLKGIAESESLANLQSTSEPSFKKR